VQNLWAHRPAPWTGSSVSAMMSTQRACPEQFRKTNRRHCEGRPLAAATWDSCRFPNANRRRPDNLLSGQRYADRKPDTRSSRTWRTARRRRAQIRRSASLGQAPAQESCIFLTPHQSAPPHKVISNGAGRRFFFPLCSCEVVGLRREKSLLLFAGFL